jgi:hypothetical protein
VDDNGWLITAGGPAGHQGDKGVGGDVTEQPVHLVGGRGDEHIASAQRLP